MDVDRLISERLYLFASDAKSVSSQDRSASR